MRNQTFTLTMNFLRIIIVAITSVLAMSTCTRGPKDKTFIFPTQREFAQFEKAIGMTSDEARELIRKSWKTQEQRTPRKVGERLVIDDRFFFSIEARKLKSQPITLTGYYVDPKTREVTFERSGESVVMRR